jgi:hypothetical protein
MDYVRCFWHVHILQLYFHNYLKLIETLLLLYSRDHMDELKKNSPRNVEKRHKEQFVGWFERKVS